MAPYTKLEDARVANAKLAQKQPLVAVFTGGTSGLGEYTLRALAKQHGTSGKGLRAYIVGRNADSASRIKADCLKLCPSGEFPFVKATDLSLLKDVDRVCNEIIRAEEEQSKDGPPKIDILVMSHSDFWIKSIRRDTPEGIDKSMSFLYYSRMRLIVKLLPLLRESPLPAHAISIYGAGLEKKKNWHPDDLSLRNPENYSMAKYRTHVIAMSTLFMEQMAKDNLGKLSLIHVFPSLVITPAFWDPTQPLWFKVVSRLALPLAMATITKSPEEIGDRLLYVATDRYPARSQTEATVSGDVAVSTDGVRGGGAYSCDYDGRTNSIEGFYAQPRTQGMAEKVWEHTQSAFAAVDKGEVFTG